MFPVWSVRKDVKSTRCKVDDALFIILYVICAMQIMSASQRDTFFNVLLNTRIRQLASIFMKRMVGAIFWMRAILRFWESAKANVDCLVFEMPYIKKFKPNLNVQTDSIRAKLFV